MVLYLETNVIYYIFKKIYVYYSLFEVDGRGLSDNTCLLN